MKFWGENVILWVYMNPEDRVERRIGEVIEGVNLHGKFLELLDKYGSSLTQEDTEIVDLSERIFTSEGVLHVDIVSLRSLPLVNLRIFESGRNLITTESGLFYSYNRDNEIEMDKSDVSVIRYFMGIYRKILEKRQSSQ